MAKVDNDINTTTVARQRCRPILSASDPKKRPPSGRAKKATANVANKASNAAVGSEEA